MYYKDWQLNVIVICYLQRDINSLKRVQRKARGFAQTATRSWAGKHWSNGETFSDLHYYIKCHNLVDIGVAPILVDIINPELVAAIISNIRNIQR